jgi:hypothetical protein
VKLEANIETVSLWQSEQLQTKLSVKPGPCVGCWKRKISTGSRLLSIIATVWLVGLLTHEGYLHGSTEASGRGLVLVAPAVGHQTGDREVFSLVF